MLWRHSPSPHAVLICFSWYFKERSLARPKKCTTWDIIVISCSMLASDLSALRTCIFVIAKAQEAFSADFDRPTLKKSACSMHKSHVSIAAPQSCAIPACLPLHSSALFTLPIESTISNHLRLGGDLSLAVGDLDTELLGTCNNLYPLPRGDSVCDPANIVSNLTSSHITHHGWTYSAA